LNLFELIEKFSGKFRDKKLRPGRKGLVKGPSGCYLEQLAAHTGISSSAGLCELIEKFTKWWEKSCDVQNVLDIT
jgi:hypothetical protein